MSNRQDPTGRNGLVPHLDASGLLVREQLLQRMGRGARLVLVRAAAGFGKTVLLRQFHERCLAAGRPALWLGLEQADNDPVRLAAQLHTGLLALDGQPPPDTPDSPPALLERLARAEHGLVLLLDDFEVLGSAEALAFVQQVLAALPADACLVIASRSNPELGLGRMRLHGLLLELDTHALRLNPAEAQAFMRGRCQVPISEAEITRLHELTEGWITGLLLASLALQGRDAPVDIISAFSGSNQELAEYLTEDILAHQDDELRLFLLKTSVLERFCAPLCDAVCQRQDSQALIDRLLRSNLFIQPTDTQQQWFRYHRLFGGFLRNALARQLPGQVADLHRRAAQWYRQQCPASTIEHLLSAGDLDQATALLQQHLNPLVDAGRLRLLLRWLERLPAQALQGQPRLALVFAWLLVLDRRYRDAMHRVECNPASLESDTVRCLLLAFTDQRDSALDAAQAQLERLPPDDTLQFAMVAMPLACCLIAIGRHDEGRALLMRMSRQAPPYRSDLVDSIILLIEGGLELNLGQRCAALARLQANAAAQKAVHERKWAAGKASLDILHALLLYEADDLAGASALLQAIPLHTLDLGGPDALIAQRVVMARIALHHGQRDTWLRHLAELEQTGRRSGSQRILCAAWLERARMATLEGRLDIAAQALGSAELAGSWDRPDVLTLACDSDTPFIARQRLDIARGEHEAAARALSAAIDFAESRQQRRRVLKLRLLLALALAAKGRQKQALDTLTPALRHASQEGFVRTFLEEGPSLVKLLERWAVAYQASCSSLGIAPEFVADLLQRSGAQADSDEGSEQADPDLLTGRELQVIRLLAAGNRNRAIAEQMHLSEHTVKTHLRNISAKLGAQGRTEVIAIARARGLLD